MTTPTLPPLLLNNGVTMPAIGLGVYQSSPEDTATAVEAALRCGYRHIDTAAAYGNEREVGEGLRASGVDRDEVFVETKVWVSDYGYDETLPAFEKSSAKLGLDVIDLLILHQPMPQHLERTVAAYHALEELLRRGSVRAIGVSNVMPHHLEALLREVDVVPAVNQVELHPYFTQPEVRAADAAHGVLTQAWSPIGGITFYRDSGDGAQRSVMDDPVIRAIAERHGRTPAQVMVRWHVQHGRSAIPKSVNPTRIAENADVAGFALADHEMAALDGLDTGRRGGPDPDGQDPLDWGLTVPEA